MIRAAKPENHVGNFGGNSRGENASFCQKIADWDAFAVASLATTFWFHRFPSCPDTKTTLIAALDTANGEVYGLFQQKHSHQEGLRFLADLP